MKWMLQFCRVAFNRYLIIAVSVPAIMAASLVARGATRPSPEFLVEGGKARAAIVLGDTAEPFYHFVGK